MRIVNDFKFRYWNDNIKKMGYLGLPNPHMSYLDSQAPLMQFTGMQDSEGSDIYEGDIVSISKQGVHIVKYSIERAWFFLEQIGRGHRSTLNIDIGDLKVIGNIYENTELLGGKS